jgi:hypothetical protein
MNYDIEFVGGIKKIQSLEVVYLSLLGYEAQENVALKSLPFSRLAGRVCVSILEAVESKGEGSILGGFR